MDAKVLRDLVEKCILCIMITVFGHVVELTNWVKLWVRQLSGMDYSSSCVDPVSTPVDMILWVNYKLFESRHWALMLYTAR